MWYITMATKTNKSMLHDYEQCIIWQEKVKYKKRSSDVQIDYIDKVKVSNIFIYFNGSHEKRKDFHYQKDDLSFSHDLVLVLKLWVVTNKNLTLPS